MSYHFNIKGALTVNLYSNAGAIFRLLVNFPTFKAVVMKAGVYEALMLGLRTYPAENGQLTISCFEVTRVLAEGNSPYRDRMVAAGACEIIVAAVRAYVKRAGTSDADVKTAARGCRAIHALAHQADPAIMDRLLTADAAGALLETLLMYGYDKETKGNASEAILALCGHEGHRKALLEKGACDEVVPVIGGR